MAFLRVYFNGELKFTAPLQPAVTSIGRTAINDVVIDNAGVSGNHAIIAQIDDAFYIEDIQSTNGVFVNGRRISREQISYGDEITIYKHTLKLIAADLSKDTLASATPSAASMNQCLTMEVDAAQLQAILRHQQAQAPYLEQTSGERQGYQWVLSKQHFDIGKNSTCDLRVGGWFTPKLIAKINRQSDGYYLNPEKKWNKIRLNGEQLNGRVKLQNLDKLQVRDIALTFYQPIVSLPPNA